MNYVDCLAWLAVGALVGWLPGFIMRSQGKVDSVLDLVAAVGGAVIGGGLVTLVESAGGGHHGVVSAVGVLASLPCSVIALSLSRQFRNQEQQAARRSRRRRLYV